jgi:hypothetical protein
MRLAQALYDAAPTSETDTTKILNSRFLVYQFLELVPDMRELIFDFYGSRYSSCLALMEKIKGDVMLDM